MRLLFDEQLSEELVTVLGDLFPDSLHVHVLGKGGASDPIIWRLAREHGCVLVTKDEDFHRLSVLRGAGGSKRKSRSRSWNSDNGIDGPTPRCTRRRR